MEEFKDYVLENLSEEIVKDITISHGNEMVILVSSDNIIQILKFLRDDVRCQFKILTDICGVDYPENEKRFEVIYNLLSVKYNHRVRIKVQLEEGQIVQSATGLYSAANWYEREVWDMYGVCFAQHPDLRRILTDYGFDGHPQRKDFPLTGYLEVKYDSEKERVIYEPVSLPQEFRSFDFVSPWEGAQYVTEQVREKRVEEKK